LAAAPAARWTVSPWQGSAVRASGPARSILAATSP
jgi:hypothetical protein